ncbi:F0F1 ATP synthase subunit epsilon [Planctomycetes bacterium Poly30]|uniref:F0F1 ATP synthase subunit epsilon n=1 Tax=Saltatorellus ferox TaxID=2528018 RepID=A0A518EVG9_9BACT|nr:F0F1 ATP synthase subunit epsilon [Planctomycetes bacterium Poly30]
MTLRVLVPFQVFAEKAHVKRIVTVTRSGSFGLLPQRLDCVATLAPGILVYETEEDGECYLAVDEGILVKTGSEVRVSVRRAVAGSDLSTLHEAVESDFLVLDDHEREVRSVNAKLESGFLRRLAHFHHE